MTNDNLQLDEANRKRALELTSFIVEAPAGAGKTELLTQRYLKLLQTVNAPEEIIAITFTNKAAAEMRLRILDSLMNAAKLTPPPQAHKQITYELSLQALQQAQTHSWQLIESPSRLRIFTIDSLCAHLARQMPLMSRFGAQPKVSDDAVILYTQAAEQTLALLEHKEYSEIVSTALRYLDNNASQLTLLLVRMLEKRDQWLHYAQSHVQTAVNMQQMQTTLNCLIEISLTHAANTLPPALQQLLMPVARFAASQKPTVIKIDTLLDWQSPLTAQTSDLSQWLALADLLLTATGELRKEAGINVKFGFPPTEEGKANKKTLVGIIAAIDNTPALHAIRGLPNSNHQADWQMIAALAKLLNLAVAQLWLVFQHAGEVDFVEIAQRAIQALTDDASEPTDLALKLDYQIKHLLVDEFQDTSPSQIKLLEQLTQGWQQNDSRTLFCVGDPMQSIYRFRKANVSLFINAARRGIGDIHLQRLQLYRNNRASPQLVGWLNLTFPALFAEFDDENQGAIQYRQSIGDANKHADDSGVEVHAIIKQDDTDAAKQAEAEAVIAIIERERAAKPNASIAVLVSAKAHLRPLVSQLRRTHAHIKFQAVEIEALAGRQIVQDLLSLTHALHHRADRVYWLSVLRAPWCGLSLHDLHALAGANHHATIWQLMQNEVIVQTLSADGQTRLQHVRRILSDAFQAQGRMNTSRWVRGVWLMLNGTACLWEQADVVDVQAFFSCLDALDRRNQFSPERMAIEIEKLFAAPDTEGELLQMMTIHKSKGLEFDTVILLGLGTATGGNSREKPLLLWEEVPSEHHTELLAAPFMPKGERSDALSVYDFLAAREKVRDANEDARVLYVAATRTERKLHLVGFAAKNKDAEIKPAANTPLALLWPTVSQYFEHLLENSELPANKLLVDDIANFSPQLVRLNQLQVPVILQSQTTTSYSSVVNMPSKTNSAEASILNSLNLYADCGNFLNIAADCGSLAHLYMQMIANDGLVHWPASRIDASTSAMRFWLTQKGHAKSEVMQSVFNIIAALKQAITSPQGAWMLESRPSRKAELSITTIDENGEPEEHRIDLTFIENDRLGEKIRWIIDYKLTAAINDDLQLVLEAYKPQLTRYAYLFAHEHLPIKTAIFLLNSGQLIVI